MNKTADPPDDDDLIAYLDGELPPDAEQAVEARLASDPAARSKADEYRKSFDLLDYLPTPTPSATFSTRTLSALQAIPPGAGSGSQPITVQSQAVSAVRRRAWPELVAWATAAVLALAAGFAMPMLVRAPAITKEPDEPSLADLPMIERLPLYAGVDDVAFLRAVQKAELFDQADKPDRVSGDLSPADRDRLIDQFKGLPAARQQQLRALHQELGELPAADAEPIARTLHAYALWLDRLPDADRKRVLDARPADRADVAAQVREGQWRESLPEKQRQAIRHSKDAEERAEAVRMVRDQEQTRRRQWELTERQWQRNSKEQEPWPFNDPSLKKQVDEYMRTAWGIDPAAPPSADKKEPLPPGCRLTREEVLALRLRREMAEREGYWLSYGAELLRLADQHPTLPRPKNPADAITRPGQLPKATVQALKAEGLPKPRLALLETRLVGKWPEYALEVARLLKTDGKAEVLGPCRPGEFTQPVEDFIKTKMDKADEKKLDAVAGRWPQYPQLLVELARAKNLSVPEVMLPGEPKKWDELYRLPSGKK